ncbi:MAG TPA: hypothetical protein VFQ45_15060 [Longimicrobium sp.]|nr:hypothetical protein [Longimicrobium sp.]
MAERTLRIRALARGVTLPDRATPLQVVQRELALLPGAPIPPRWAMRDVLARGHGVQEPAEWDAFEATDDELAGIEAALEDAGFRREACPEWIETPRQWIAWAHAVHFHAPPRRYVTLSEREHALGEDICRALDGGDEERANRLHVERLGVGRKLQRLMRGLP